MLKYCFSFLFLFISVSSAQEVTISGFVRDSSNGEALIGTNIYLPDLQTGTSTNQYGFFSVSVPPGEYILRLSYVGYQTKEVAVSLSENKKMNFELVDKSLSTEEVVVISEAEDQNVNSTEMGITRI